MTLERAISVSGAEFTPQTTTATQAFSNVRVQTLNSDYRYEGITNTTTSFNRLTFNYLYGRGFRTVKIPIRWERIQRTLGGALSSTDVALLTKELDQANLAGLKVVIDIHNYGLYYLDGSQTSPTQAANTGYRFPIGSTTVTQAHFADLWTRMATQFASHPAVVGFHIMNEPQPAGGLTRATWYSCAQAAVDAIRAVSTSVIIRVGGWQWSDTVNWTTNNPSGPWITDTTGKLWYETHHYWDEDSSGAYTTYANAVADAVAKGYSAGSNPDALHTKIFDELNQWITWLNTYNLKGVVGELSWPGNGTSGDNASWNALANAYLTRIDSAGVNADFWSTGEFYGNAADPLLFYYSTSLSLGVNTSRPNSSQAEAHLVAQPTSIDLSFARINVPDVNLAQIRVGWAQLNAPIPARILVSNYLVNVPGLSTMHLSQTALKIPDFSKVLISYVRLTHPRFTPTGGPMVDICRVFMYIPLPDDDVPAYQIDTSGKLKAMASKSTW